MRHAALSDHLMLPDLTQPLIDAFDHWTGRYIGPLTTDVALSMENHPDLLGPLVTDYPRRFATLVTDAIVADLSGERGRLANDIAQTLRSTAYGIKHETRTREDFRARMTIAIDLLLVALQGVGQEPTAPPPPPRSG